MGCAPPTWSTCAESRSTSDGDAARAEGQERQAASLLPIVERAGLVADLGIKLHAHMLRHSTGYNDALMMLRLNMSDPTS